MVLPKRERRAEENQAFVVETFERRKSSIRRTVAICPVVVTRREDGRRFQRIKITKGLDVQGIAASGGGGRVGSRVACLQISIVGGKFKVLRVHVSDQVRHARGGLDVRVGEVAPESNRIHVMPLILVALAFGRIAVKPRSYSRSCRENQHRNDKDEKSAYRV